VVKEVEANIKRRKRVGSVKAVLKRDAIEKLKERLMTAQSMLMLSNNMYLV
jgi:cell division protein FtsX